MTKVLVTGGAGFIGSNLVDLLIQGGNDVHVIDDLSTGLREFLNPEATFIESDLLDDSFDVAKACEGVTTVYHLAANADVKDGWLHPDKDLHQNVRATLRVAEACRLAGVADLVFTSTGSVYGEAKIFPTPETEPFPRQTSLYGASKVAAEGFLEAYAEAGFFGVTIFRLVSSLGPRYTHGHVIDFVRQLTSHPDRLMVLGNGFQEKSYFHVSDCVRALTSLRGQSGANVFNIGRPDTTTVRESIAVITQALGVSPDVQFGDANQGWIGDNPRILLDTARAQAAGWVPQWGLREAIEDTVRYLVDNPHLMATASA
ncbi:MAG: NAD-dependent epimerase/dehydratase family protein [Actinobacteria bacterium]|nr:NAD-dependent epimerase/dehydratase family protein [Actinomycetota bacterium]